MKRTSLWAIAAVIAALAVVPASGVTLSFEQVSWLDPNGGYVSQDSDWGQVLIDLSAADDALFHNMTLADGTSGRGGYINIVTDSGGAPDWDVANLPIFYQVPTELDGRLPQEVKFDLGVVPGTPVTGLNYYWTIDPMPLAAMPGGGAGGAATVVPFDQFTAGDNLWLRYTHVEGGGQGTPQPAENFQGAGAGETVGSQSTIAVPEANVPAVNEDKNGCAPGSVARSIMYMDSANDNISLPAGTTAQGVYGGLKTAMGTDANGTSTTAILSGKNAYVDGLGLPIVSTQTKKFSAAMDTLKNKGDVELGVNWGTGADGNSLGAHRTFVSGIQEIVDAEGNTTGYIVTTVDDPTQGDGNAENRSHTMKFDANGKLVQYDGHGVAADAGLINFQIQNVVASKTIMQWQGAGGFYMLPPGSEIPIPGGSIPVGPAGEPNAIGSVAIRYLGAQAMGGANFVISQLLVNLDPNGGVPPERTDSLLMQLDADIDLTDPSISTFINVGLHIGHLLPGGDPVTGPFGTFMPAIGDDDVVMLENLVVTSSFFDITYSVQSPGEPEQLFRLHGEIPEYLLGKAWLLGMENSDPDWWVDSFFDVFFEIEVSPEAYDVFHSPLLDMEFFAVQVLRGGSVNVAPVVSAGPDKTISLPAPATLDGTVTDDGNPNPPAALTYTWSMVSGPVVPIFGTPGAVDTTATFATNGTYVLRLTASDSELSASDDVQFIVLKDLRADFNNDGFVDGLDFLRWQANFNKWPTGGATKDTGDANGDGMVDGLDFLIWQAGFNR